MNERLFATIAVAFAATSSSPVAADSVQQLPGAGEVRIDINVEARIAEDNILEPTAVALDIYYGLHNMLVLGLTHSAASQGVFGVGRSVQIAGDEDPYNGFRFEVLAPLLNSSTFTLAPQAALGVDSLGPTNMSLKAGALAFISLPMIAITANPYVNVPINRTSGRDTTVHVPVWVQISTFYLLTGLNDEHIQGGLGITASLFGWRAGAQIGWPRLVGDNRELKDVNACLFAQIRI